MKKVVRTVWIGALTGLAFLAACCSTKGLSRAERKQLIKERDSIQDILTRREGETVYGTPQIMAERAVETYRLRSQLDSINYKLGEDVDLEKSARRLALQERIAELQAAIERREGACVYGSPEIIQRYGLETLRLRSQLDTINYRLGEDVDLEQSAQRVRDKELQIEKMESIREKRERLEVLRNTIKERDVRREMDRGDY